MNKIRFFSGIIYFVIAFFCLSVNQSFLLSMTQGVFANEMKAFPQEAIWWSFGWVYLGIGAWLINTRDWQNPMDKKIRHYFFYYPFASVICMLASTVAGLSFARDPYSAPKFLFMTAFVGIASGFSVEKMDEIVKLIKHW